MYSFLKLKLILQSMSWISGVVLGGKKSTVIKLNSSSDGSSKSEGYAGASSIIRRHLKTADYSGCIFSHLDIMLYLSIH